MLLYLLNVISMFVFCVLFYGIKNNKPIFKMKSEVSL